MSERKWNTAKATLTINITYDANGTDIEEFRSVLKKAADFLAAEGLLSCDLPAEVKTWDSSVHVKIGDPDSFKS